MNKGIQGLTRRGWLIAMAGIIAVPVFTWGQGMPEITQPRATSGDSVVEPDWEERLTMTVGPDKADLCGTTDRVIQAAVDYMARLGGGTVQILPGEYLLRNSIFLKSNIRLVGSGTDTILTKGASAETTLLENSDWYEQEITLKDSTGFKVGDGVCLISKNPHTGARDVLRRTLVARSGDRFKLDKALRKNFWTAQTPQVIGLFPLITAEYESDMCIENLAVDGNRDETPFLDGNYTGCIWFQDCSNITLRGVTAHHQNGDAISWQICHDVLVEDCHVYDNASLGLHPGSGLKRSIMRNNTIERNKIGLFFCWGVTHGLAENNTIADSLETGLSIGHRDNYNIVRNNRITGSGKTGILFRKDARDVSFAPKGNLIEGNQLQDNGTEDSAVVDIDGFAEGNILKNNTIRESRGAAQRIGIRIGAESADNEFIDNSIEGVATDIEDLR